MQGRILNTGLLKAKFPSSYLCTQAIYAFFYISRILAVPVHRFLLLSDVSFPTTQQLWLLATPWHHTVLCLFLLPAWYYVFTCLFLPYLLQASCMSIINLYHSLDNCLTFTSCVWGACLGKWNGSALLQGHINHLVSFTCTSFFSPVTLS